MILWLYDPIVYQIENRSINNDGLENFCKVERKRKSPLTRFVKERYSWMQLTMVYLWNRSLGRKTRLLCPNFLYFFRHIFSSFFVVFEILNNIMNRSINELSC